MLNLEGVAEVGGGVAKDIIVYWVYWKRMHTLDDHF